MSVVALARYRMDECSAQGREWMNVGYVRVCTRVSEKLFHMLAKNPKAKCLDDGCVSILKPYEQQLLRYIFELREKGAKVMIMMVLVYVATLSQDFCSKSQGSQLKLASEFVHFIYKTSTNVSQQSPESMFAEAADFMEQIHPILVHQSYSPEFTINIDQASV